MENIETVRIGIVNWIASKFSDYHNRPVGVKPYADVPYEGLNFTDFLTTVATRFNNKDVDLRSYTRDDLEIAITFRNLANAPVQWHYQIVLSNARKDKQEFVCQGFDVKSIDNAYERELDLRVEKLSKYLHKLMETVKEFDTFDWSTARDLNFLHAATIRYLDDSICEKFDKTKTLKKRVLAHLKTQELVYIDRRSWIRGDASCLAKEFENADFVQYKIMKETKQTYEIKYQVNGEGDINTRRVKKENLVNAIEYPLITLV